MRRGIKSPAQHLPPTEGGTHKSMDIKSVINAPVFNIIAGAMMGLVAGITLGVIANGAQYDAFRRTCKQYDMDTIRVGAQYFCTPYRR